jgi:hypothetical protein
MMHFTILTLTHLEKRLCALQDSLKGNLMKNISLTKLVEYWTSIEIYARGREKFFNFISIMPIFVALIHLPGMVRA